jgi:hypothetical protein
MSSTGYTSETRAEKETSSLEESLKSIKVDEGKCKNEIGVSSLSDASYFTMKASKTTFATYAIVLGMRIVP